MKKLCSSAGIRPGNIIVFSIIFALAATTASTASAQYGGGYGSGTAAGVGAGAAAGVGAIFLAVHYHGRVTGCVQNGDDGLRFIDDKKGVSYSLDARAVFLKPGQHVELKGSKAMQSGGTPSFKAKKLIKDLGSCGAESVAPTTSTSGH